MYSDKNFQINKVKRLIETRGTNLIFKRYNKNEYGEYLKDDAEEIEIKGLYHEESSQITLTTTEGTVTRSKVQPRVLCMIEDGKKIKRNDRLFYEGSEYSVVDAINLLKSDICFDISLEVFDNGE